MTRYGTYALQFVVSLGIASKLGPYYLGVYGFIQLILMYFQQINFGIPHSLNVFLVHEKKDKDRCERYISNSLWLYGVVSFIVLLLYLYAQLFSPDIFGSYKIDKFLPAISIIAILVYFNSIFSTILRARNKVNQLSFVLSVNVLINGIALLLFESYTLIWALLASQILSGVITSFVAIKSGVLPKLPNAIPALAIQKAILHKGLYLFLYNSCFYIINVSNRTIISIYYAVEEFGLFTFSFTIAHGVMMLLDSLMTLIFPKVIDLLSFKDVKVVEKNINTVRIAFVSSSHLLIYVGMLFFPLLVALMPTYSSALTSLNLIALTILMNTNGYGYTSLLIAQNKERTSAFISICALVVNVLCGMFLVTIVHVSFSYVILATVVAYLVFTFLCYMYGRRLLGVFTWRNAILHFFPIRLLVPYAAALAISIFQAEILVFIPIVLFVILNWKDIMAIKQLALKLYKNPNIADI